MIADPRVIYANNSLQYDFIEIFLLFLVFALQHDFVAPIDFYFENALQTDFVERLKTEFWQTLKKKLLL